MAPVAKGKQEIYGRIVGHNINQGKSLEAAKHIADKAVKHRGVNDKGLSKGAKSSENPTSVARQVANDRRLTPATAGNIRTKDAGPGGETYGAET